MKDVGIVGLPRSGKTTLFNALTRAGAPAGGAAGKASVAAVPVPDFRVDVLAELERSRKKVFVQARFVDVAGLSVGGPGGGLAAQGPGGPGGSSLAPRYLGALREADALAMVLAAWDEAGPDPAEAAAELTLELTVADLESIAGGADKATKKAKAGVNDAALEASVLARARDLLDQGTPLRAADWEPQEARVLRNFAPLTLKPALAFLAAFSAPPAMDSRSATVSSRVSSAAASTGSGPLSSQAASTMARASASRRAPSPWAARPPPGPPADSPATSTNRAWANTRLRERSSSDRTSTRGSGTGTAATLALPAAPPAGTPARVSALKRVVLPLWGSPTMPTSLM